jgi:large subunit ribosomal protein L22
MDFKATQKFVVTTPRKLREVVALVKDMSPKDAVERLPYVQKRAAEPLRKVIKTAIANAKQADINVEDLTLKEIQIGEGPRLKRWRAGARGRAKPYAKRMSHIRVILEAKEKKTKKTAKSVSGKTKSKEKEVVSKAKSKTPLSALKKITGRKTNKKKGDKKDKSV